jgi:hypothetical protein
LDTTPSRWFNAKRTARAEQHQRLNNALAALAATYIIDTHYDASEELRMINHIARKREREKITDLLYVR